MGAAKVRADAVGDLLGVEQAGWLENGTLGVHPLGLNRVEPRALDRQIAGEDAHAVAALLHLLVVGADPGADALAHMPRGVVPDQDPDPYTRLLQPAHTPVQELLGDRADRPPSDEAQPHALRLAHLAQQHPIAGQRLGVGIARGDRLLDQAQRAVGRVRPGMRLRLGEATPPGFIREAQRPVGMLGCQGNQAVTLPFFRAYPGSGLVIQCVARFQPVPRRRRVWRIVSPLTRMGTIPTATLTSAAHSRVHRLPGLPKSRGLRCKSARSRSACSGPKTKRVRWAREDFFCKHASPVALKACSASSTVWSSMPRYVAMRGARSPRALANRIWQRRKTKASLERRPCSSTSRSSSVSVRTKRGGLMSTSVPHPRLPI